MKAAEIVVVAEGVVLVAGFPVARRLHLEAQRAVVQHRQVEAAAVPAHEIGRELFDAVEEAFHQLALRRALARPGSRRGSLRASGMRRRWRRCGAARAAGNRCPIPGARAPAWPCRLRRRTGLRARTGAGRTPRRERFRCRIPGCSSTRLSSPSPSRFGFAFAFAFFVRLGRGASSTATATMSPASSVSVTCPSPMPSLRRTFSPRGEYATSGLPQAFCTHADVADPDAVRETRAHGLDDGFLGGEAHGEESLGTLRSRRAARARPACSRRSTNARRTVASTFLMRAASSTSTPMPKIIGALRSSAPSCRARPLRGR